AAAPGPTAAEARAGAPRRPGAPRCPPHVVVQLGQKLRSLQEKATRFSSRQSGQRTLTNPLASTPQSTKPRRARRTCRGGSWVERNVFRCTRITSCRSDGEDLAVRDGG